MASITSTGIGSGLDVSAIVTQLMAIESQPLTLLQNSAADINTQLSAFGKVQSLTSSMRDAAQAVSSISLWKKTTAASGDATSVGVSSSDGAAVGSYSVSVQALAAGQTVSSRAVASSAATLGAGTLTIELGSWTTANGTSSFAGKADSGAVTITIDPDDTSLAAIRDKINGANAGVTASIVNDATGSRLALRSATTGAENGFRISTSEDSDDGDATTGLSMLAYDPAGSDSQMTLNQSAVNAQATINGIVVTSATNKLEGVADGLTLSLLKTTTSAVDVSVAADSASVKTAITNFVTQFNALASNLSSQTKYDADAKTGGTLQGDRTTTSLIYQLRGVLNQANGASSMYSVLSDIGITMQTNGTLAVDSTKLDNAIAQPNELRKLLANDGTTDADTGFMLRFRKLGDALLNTDGAFTTHTSSLQAMLKQNGNSQDAMELRLTQTETRLRKQYQALDTSMASLNSLSSYLTNQLAALSSSSN